VIGLDNIFLLPSDLEERPEIMIQLPSPEDLKNKFIIKCKAKRRLPKLIESFQALSLS
jgi:hypothetical protein